MSGTADKAALATLRTELGAILQKPPLRGAEVGVIVTSIATGEILFESSSKKPLCPASNTKIFTTATGLALLGSDYVYRTRLVGAVPDEDGTIHGGVLLLGGHDPTMATLDVAEMADQLVASGVRSIDGELDVVDDGALAAPASNEPETVTVVVTPADKTGAQAAAIADSEVLPLVDHATTAARGRSAVSVSLESDGQGAERLRVDGRIPAGADPVVVHFSLGTGPLAIGARLAASLHDAGIATGALRVLTKAPSDTDLETLAEHDSVPLAVLEREINKPSDNFLADSLLRTVGGELGGSWTLPAGAAVERSFLASVGLKSGSYTLNDGSGLSHGNRVSPSEIAALLLHMYNDFTIGPDWLASLSIGGFDGTLRRRFIGHPAAGWVRGKTGTLSSVSALSGFVGGGGTATADDVLCFSIMVNGFADGQKQAVRKAQVAMVDAMSAYLTGTTAPEPDAAGSTGTPTGTADPDEP